MKKISALLLILCLLLLWGCTAPQSTVPTPSENPAASGASGEYADFLPGEFVAGDTQPYFTLQGNDGIWTIASGSSVASLWCAALQPEQLSLREDGLYYIGATALDGQGQPVDTGLFAAQNGEARLLIQGEIQWYAFWEDILLTATKDAVYASTEITALPHTLFEGTVSSCGLVVQENILIILSGDKLLALELSAELSAQTPSTLQESGAVQLLESGGKVFFTTEEDQTVYICEKEGTAAAASLPEVPFALQDGKIMTAQKQADGLQLFADGQTALFLLGYEACSLPFLYNDITFFYAVAEDYAGWIGVNDKGAVTRYSHGEG